MCLIVPITDKWRIELDECSWAVAKHQPRKDKKRKQWEQVSWHRTLHQAAENVRERLLSNSEAYGVDEVLKAISSSTQLITDAIKESEAPDSWLAAKEVADG